MKAMILAAGFGERLRPLTETTPKPLLKVGDKPLIQYHIENLVAAGVREIIINTSWLGEQIEAFLGDGSRFGAQIQWSREEQPLETGGGVRRALPMLGSEPFLIVNGDVWCEYPLQKLVDISLSEDQDAHLVLVPSPIHNARGDFCLDNEGFVRYPQDGETTYTFSGFSLMRPEIFALFTSASDKFPLRDVLASGINAGCVTGEIHSGIWWDVGTLERLEALNGLLGGKEVSPGKKPRMRLS